MRWRDVRPGKKQFEFDMNPDDMVFFDEVRTDPVEDQIVAMVRWTRQVGLRWMWRPGGPGRI